MRSFVLLALFTALFLTSAAHAEGAKQVMLTVKGALVSIPNSDITLELGQDTSPPVATESRNGVLTLRLVSSSQKSGFVIKGLSMSQFSVTFTPKGQTKAVDVDPNLIADRAFTYLPLPSAMGGGTFNVILPSPPGLQKNNKGFLN